MGNRALRKWGKAEFSFGCSLLKCWVGLRQGLPDRKSDIKLATPERVGVTGECHPRVGGKCNCDNGWNRPRREKREIERRITHYPYT